MCCLHLELLRVLSHICSIEKFNNNSLKFIEIFEIPGIYLFLPSLSLLSLSSLSKSSSSPLSLQIFASLSLAYNNSNYFP